MSTLFGLSSKEISHLSPEGFVGLINMLLRAEANQLGISPLDVHTTLRIYEPDDGVDALIANAPAGSDFIPAGASVWQFKSGKDHDPATLKAELKKEGVKEALQNGATYCLVICDDIPRTSKQFKNREGALREGFNALRYLKVSQKQRGPILTADKISEWTSLHPSSWLTHRPLKGCMNWEGWEKKHPEPLATFLPDPAREQLILRIKNNSVPHFRIEGRAGIGKTRLVLEAFRPGGVGTKNQSGNADRVLYAPTPDDIAPEFWSWLASNKTRMSLVVDECDQLTAEELAGQANRCEGRVSLITIGVSEDLSTRTPPNVVVLDRLDNTVMEKILSSTAATLPKEHIPFIVRLVEGYVKLGVAVARAALEHPDLTDAQNLARAYRVKPVLDKLFFAKPEALEAMKVVALLRQTGWDGEFASEGECITGFFGLVWKKVRQEVSAQQKKGLVSVKGRYRYVTPHILAVWLAAQTWEAQGNQLLDLLDKLPGWKSRHSFLQRLRDLGNDPQAKGAVEHLLGPRGPFQGTDVLSDVARAEALRILAEASPKSGLNALERILEHLARDELQQFLGGMNRVIWTLSHLAWEEDTFFGAARLLRKLAEAEGEGLREASKAFAGLFSLYLGGTKVPGRERYILLEEALSSDSQAQHLLAVAALGVSLAPSSHWVVRSKHDEDRDEPTDWRPKTIQEDQNARREALALLDRALSSGDAKVREAAGKVVLEAALELVSIGLVDELFAKLESLVRSDFSERRKLRAAIENIKKVQGLTPTQKGVLGGLWQSLVGSSFTERLHRWVGERTIADELLDEDDGDKKADEQAAKLADEAVLSPEKLQSEWNWLCSPEARHSFPFAERLGELDQEKRFWKDIESRLLQGSGRFFASAYLRGQVKAGRREFRDSLIDQWIQTRPEFALAAFEVIWRGESNDKDAERLIAMLDSGSVPPEHFRFLVWGAPHKYFSTEKLQAIFEKLLQKDTQGAVAAVVEVLDQRLQLFPNEVSAMTDLAMRAIESQNIPWDETGAPPHWAQLVQRYLAKQPKKLAQLVLSLLETQAWRSHQSLMMRLLHQAAAVDAKGTWEEVGGILLKEERDAYYLKRALRDNFLAVIPDAILLDWAARFKPQGPRVVAELLPITDESDDEPNKKQILSPLVRELLVQFGNDARVGDFLSIGVHSGGWVGPMSGWVKSRLGLVRPLCTDTNPRVRAWAKAEVDRLEKELEHTIMTEEEGHL